MLDAKNSLNLIKYFQENINPLIVPKPLEYKLNISYISNKKVKIKAKLKIGLKNQKMELYLFMTTVLCKCYQANHNDFRPIKNFEFKPKTNKVKITTKIIISQMIANDS